MNKLLIYIPSYNRYDYLIRQLNLLCSEIQEDLISNVNIVVSDNASSDYRYHHLQDIYPSPLVRIKRNRLNIGSVGNVTRGFEEDNWDYIWILGDDDEVKPGACKIISNEIAYGDCSIYYLKCKIKGNERVYDGEIITNQHDYFSKFSALAMMGFISANVFSRAIVQYIEYMYLYGYTLFPFLAAVFKLSEHKNFSLKCIGGDLVAWTPNNRSYDHIYDMAITNFLTLTELLSDCNAKKTLIDMFTQDFGVSHYFHITLRKKRHFIKAISQIGFGRTVSISFRYLIIRVRSNVSCFIKRIICN